MKPSTAIKDIAEAILELTYRDMQTLTEALGATSYSSKKSEDILKWAEGVVEADRNAPPYRYDRPADRPEPPPAPEKWSPTDPDQLT